MVVQFNACFGMGWVAERAQNISISARHAMLICSVKTSPNGKGAFFEYEMNGDTVDMVRRLAFPTSDAAYAAHKELIQAMNKAGM